MIVSMYSSGAGSWKAAHRAKDAHPGELFVALFTDVLGEDEDNYRFLIESAAELFDVTLPAGWQELVPTEQVKRIEQITPLREFAREHIPNLVWLVEGRNIWQVFADKRFLGNSRQANCSHILKQEPAKKWLKENAPLATQATVVVGIDWMESHRLAGVTRGWAPYPVEAPLCDEPYVEKIDVLNELRSIGIEPPRLYRYGFAHANCGGGCVRSGQGQFANLLEIMPERFEMWEQNEAGMRAMLGRDVTIMRESAKDGTKKTVNLTLQTLRERVEAKEEVDRFDVGGCGCFTDESGDDADAG